MSAPVVRPLVVGEPAPAADTLLALDQVVKHFPGRRKQPPVRAVDGVSLSVRRGETVGLVGESGSGKSTLGRLALSLLTPTAGTVRFDGTDVSTLRRRDLEHLRRRMQLVFQDPVSSFSPRMTIEEVLTEPMIVHGVGNKDSRRKRCRELLDLVGLPVTALERYPHQFSGGQAQRIGIARALTTNPELIVCDEAVSALDVSVQAQILNLLRDVQRELGLSYLFIAHDLNVVRYMSDRISVMYLGKLVESGPTDTLMGAPLHPYTAALVEAVPSLERRGELRAPLSGEIPSPSRPPSGCHFHTRCPRRFEPCDHVEPDLVAFGDRSAACHLVQGAESGARS
ncbi:ABC transporter ATP-binding protein [Aeromicrobium senzhongii]|uniref:ABC transporter ATP-binding protein n=1 Tax=Aeromicrobium senzhongii TaxID=2663859 RepID=A0ABX6STD6_9ACTN|nr:ABC transporter ATP-binding protein [Aeromicrobium senzhongii]MTB89546.1 ATP-binding cassette domain-containing protein [Aeromicrobium senzhongii]QNL94326.1 ABC transporter ATP-binding protein [Aeromicrobium senzhongii]